MNGEGNERPGGTGPAGEVDVPRPERGELDVPRPGPPTIDFFRRPGVGNVDSARPRPGEVGFPRPAAGAGGSAPAGGRVPKPWARVLTALLLAGLGFAISVSVRAASGPAGLSTARQEDLVRILDDLDARGQRLRADVEVLQRTRDRLAAGGGVGDAAALSDARARTAGLGILAGVVPARGPGIVLTIDDPRRQVGADVLVDVTQELRDAGAEAIDLSGIRVVASTYLVDGPTGVVVDGTGLRPPYRFTVIGDPRTLAQALQIPGGVADTVASRPGAGARVEQRARVDVASLRSLPTPRYARPAR